MKFVAFLLGAFCTTTALANQNDLKQDGEFGKPSAKLGLYVDAEADIGEGSFERQRLDFSTPLFYKSIGEHAFFAGLRYKLDHFETSGFDGIDDIDYLHHIQIPVGWRWSPDNSPWGAFLNIRPGVASDFNNVGSDAFSFAAFGIVTYEVSDTLTLGGGAYYSRDFGEDRIFPGVGLIWTPTPDWRLDFLGPKIILAHRPSDNWIVKITAETSGGSWNVTQNGINEDIDLRSFRVGLGVERRLSKNLWLEAWAGSTLGQQLELQRDGSTLFKEDISDSAFGYVGLRVTFW